jgi:hypothetical protein
MHTKQGPYRTYAVAARVPKGAITQALYWDTPDPYHYIRLQAGEPGAGGQPAEHDLLIVGGEDHKVGHDDPAARLACLEDWTRAHFPQLIDIAYRWSGQVLEPNDSLAYAGRNPLDSENVYIITGDSGHGMTHGTLGAMLLRDLILGRPNPWADLYDPGRVTLKPYSLLEFARENALVAADYTDLLTGGDVASAEEIAPGSGAVLRHGLTKVAVYKDPQGQVHAPGLCSALERPGNQLGLPLPRLALQCLWPTAQRPRQLRPSGCREIAQAFRPRVCCTPGSPTRNPRYFPALLTAL